MNVATRKEADSLSPPLLTPANGFSLLLESSTRQKSQSESCTVQCSGHRQCVAIGCLMCGRVLNCMWF